MKKLFTFIICLAIYGIAFNQTNVSGTISSDSIWDISGSPYIVTGNLTVSSGATLTVDPSVDVQFDNSRIMYVYGALNATTTTFTSSDPSPYPGIWQYIQFGNSTYSGQGLLQSCQFEYAQKLYVNNGTVTINNSTINSFYYYGIESYDTVNVQNTSIDMENYYSSYGYAIYARTEGVIDLDDVQITNCRQGLHIEAGSSVTMDNNSSISYSNQSGALVYGLLNMTDVNINMLGYTSSGYGINAYYGSDIQLTNVNITNCNYGISIFSTSNITLSVCNIALCEWPIFFQGPGSLITNGTNDFTGNTRDAAYISFTTLSSNWSLPYINVPYYFNGSFTVDNGYTLNIASDNILKFRTGYYGLFINGTLIANADPGNNIFFTSDRDDNWGGDTNNDGSSTSPASGDWHGVTFNDPSNDASCILRKCKIRFAGRDNRGAINTIDASPTIDSCDLSNSYYGIKIQNASNPTFTNNTIGSSQMTPIALSYEANPVFSGNVLSFSDNEYDAIGLLGGTLTADATLPIRNISATPNITYLMLDNITVPQGLTLTINKGVVIKAYLQNYPYDYRKFIIEGKLSAIGTADSMIVFTSARDDNFGNPFDTNKDGSQTSPAIGDWGGIVFKVNSDADSKLEYCRIYYGDNNDYYSYPTISPWSRFGGQITIDNASPQIINCDIKHNEFGIYCGGDSQPIIWNNSFDNSTSTPIAISITAAPDLTGNTIVNPGYYALGIIGEELGVTGSLTQKNFAGYSNITYMLLENLYINSGTYVTVDSGVVIKVNSQKWVEVNGGLKTIDPVTSNDKVVFTSLKDDNEGNPGDTNNDGSSTSPAAGDWGRIQLNETSDDGFCYLEDFKVKYGGYGDNGAIACISANTNLSDGEVYFSSNYGFFIDGSSVPVIDNVIIQNCTTDPIAMSLKSDPQLTNISFIGNGSNGIRIIEGTLSSNATLSKRDVAGINNIAYLVQHLTIGANAILNIEPGVVIKFPYESYYYDKGYIMVNGGLSVNATFNEPVIFTSDRDDSYGGDTNNDGNTTTPNKGDWCFIKFIDSGLSDQNYLNNCVFSYGGYHRSWDDNSKAKDFGLVNINNTSVEIDSCVFEQAIYSGIGIYGNADPVITNSHFNNITYTPVTMSMFSEPVFGNNQISNIGLTAIGIAVENYSVSATVPIRDFAGFQNITYVFYNYLYIESIHSSINSGTIITIPPGIVFKYKNLNGYEVYSSVLDINGGLTINGTASQPVIFTDYRDDSYGNPMDTNGDGTSTEPAIDGDYILNFTDISDDPNCQINHTILKYQNYAMQIQQASPKINACLFENNNWGITMSGVSEPVIDSCTFFNLTYTPFQYSLVSYPISTVNNTISGTTYKALGIKGETMAQDVTLPKRNFGGTNNILYYFHDNFTIGTSSIMTIEPGVTLKFNDNILLTVKKGLMAEGGATPDSTICFTDIRDDYYGGDTNADSTATQPGHSYNPYQNPWRGIVFENESNDALCRLDHCVVRYAGYNYYNDYPGITTNSASPSILNSQIYKNRIGIQANGASNPIINNCDIYENQVYGIQNAGMAFNINAENCWWGSNTGPTHAGNPGGTGDVVSDMVDYDPWLTNGAYNPLMGDVSLNGEILAYDASLVLLYVVDPITYPLNQTQQMVADVSGNGTVSAYDASLILQYVVGFINYFPAELKTPLPNFVSEVGLIVGIEAVEPGEVFNLPLSIADVSGVYAMQIIIEYNHEFLEALEIESMLTGMNATYGIDEEHGLIKIAFAGIESLESDMTIANILFKASDELTTGITTQVTAKFFMANETDLTWNVTNGSVSINGFATGFGDNFENEDKLLTCYPNPFTDNLKINYTVLIDGDHVLLTVYDMYGQAVAEIVNSTHSKGTYTISWNGNDLNGKKLTRGTYFIRLIAGNKVETQKIQVVR